MPPIPRHDACCVRLALHLQQPHLRALRTVYNVGSPRVVGRGAQLGKDFDVRLLSTEKGWEAKGEEGLEDKFATNPN